MKNVALDRRGAVAAISAVVMVAVVGFAGLAIDVSRIWMLSARLKTAVDAASLIAARTMTTTTTNGQTTTTTDETATRQLFWANFHQNGWSNAYLGSTLGSATTTPTIEPISQTRIRVTATASLNTTLFGIISRQTTPLSETTVAEREGGGLELAIVLDQTSSMLDSTPGYTSKLAAAQAAVRTMLNKLFGGAETGRNLYVSVVPFARTINFGTGYSDFLDQSSMPTEWNVNNWTGCVEARRGGEDITDSAPVSGNTLFRPYFYPNTYRRVGWATVSASGSGSNAVPASPSDTVVQLAKNATIWSNLTGQASYAGAGACTTSNAYGAVTVNLYATANATSTTAYTLRFCRGDNDFGNASLSSSSGNANYNAFYATLRNQDFTGIGYTATSAAGPNMLCAMNSILPLTATRSTIVNAVNAIQAPTRSGGTTTVVGMQGAWYTLSPNWRNSWRGLPSSNTYGALPLAYGTRAMTKAVVMLTDGDNNWQCLYGNSQNSGSACATSPTRAARPSGGPLANGVEMLYNAYGRAADWNANFGSSLDFTASPTQTAGDTRLDSRFTSICSAMKNSSSTNPADHQIRIYIIGFEIDNVSVGSASTIRTMLRNCASSSAEPYFMEAPSAAQLESAFSTIADSLSSLRLIE